MNSARLTLFITATFVTAAALAFESSPGTDYEMASFTVDGGGGTSTGSDLQVSGTIGQPDPGLLAGGGYTLAGGYWADPSPACLGDTDGNGIIDVDDLVSIILDWGTDGSANGGDIDGSGVVDVDDLVTVILNWGACP